MPYCMACPEVARLELAERTALEEERKKNAEALRHRSAMKALHEKASSHKISAPKKRSLQAQHAKLARKEAAALHAVYRVRYTHAVRLHGISWGLTLRVTVRAQAQIRVELLRETKKAMARVLSPCGWAAEAALLQRQLLAAKQAMEVLLACATMPNDGRCWTAHVWSVRLQSTCMLTSGKPMRHRCGSQGQADVWIH